MQKVNENVQNNNNNNFKKNYKIKKIIKSNNLNLKIYKKIKIPF